MMDPKLRAARSAAVSVAMAISTMAASAGAQVPAELVLQAGDTPPGAGGAVVVGVYNPHTNGLGQVGFVATLDNGDHLLWRDNAIVWLGSDEPNATLSFDTIYDVSWMGISDGGAFVYEPDVDGNESIWTDGGLLVQAFTQAPGFTPGWQLIWNSRSMMLPNGSIHFLSYVDEDGDGNADFNVIYATADGSYAGLTPGLRSGDNIGGLAVSYLDDTFRMSDDGQHAIHVAYFATGDAATDMGVIVDGQLALQEGSATGDGDNWGFFDLVAINDAGDYLVAGDTDGDAASDEFIAYNGAIVLRQGDTLDSMGLGATVRTASINNTGYAAHSWTTAAGEVLFWSCDAADLAASSTAVLAGGDTVDIDGDSAADATVTDFEADVVLGPGIDLAEDMSLYLEVELDDGSSTRDAILRLEMHCCGNSLIDVNEDCDDGGESASCDDDCTAAVCGDGSINATAGESCDAGGVATSSCDLDCTAVQCGDGEANPAAGEQCDDGGESATCDADCSAVVCGDGVVNSTAGEDCEQGGVETADCDDDCTTVACGDGTSNTTAGEACDDGGESATCDADCTPTSCGDGTRNAAAGEQCDDGNTAAGDGCSPLCQDEAGGEGGSGGGPADEGSFVVQDSGCGCALVGRADRARSALIALVVLGLLVFQRRSIAPLDRPASRPSAKARAEQRAERTGRTRARSADAQRRITGGSRAVAVVQQSRDRTPARRRSWQRRSRGGGARST